MKIAAYCRVSTDTSDQLNSLQTQKSFFTEYTQKNGHTLVRLYADEGISGTSIKKRKEFQRLMQDAQQGLFEMVVVKDISRFARNTVDLLQNVRILKALGIETTFLTANMTVLGQSEFVLTVFGALAQEESANTSKRVKFGKKLNAEKGRVPNIVYGYDKTPGEYFNLTINEKEAATVREIFDWYTNQGYGAYKIAQMLNERHVNTKRNCTWSQKAVCRILTNALYTGKIINGKEEVADFLTGQRKAKEEASWMIAEKPELRIVAAEQYEQAARILKQRNEAFKLDREKHSNKYPFSTLIKCKECGWSFRRIVRTYKNTYITWTCSQHNGRGAGSCCNETVIKEEELIHALEMYFTAVLSSREDALQYIVQEFSKAYKSNESDGSTEKEWQTQLHKLRKIRQKYMDMYTDDLITREELTEKIGSIRNEMERLESDLKLSAENVMPRNQVKEIIQHAFRKIEDVPSVRNMTNAHLKQLVRKIEVDQEGNVDIHLCVFDEIGLDSTIPFAVNRT